VSRSPFGNGALAHSLFKGKAQDLPNFAHNDSPVDHGGASHTDVWMAFSLWYPRAASSRCAYGYWVWEKEGCQAVKRS